MSWLTWEERNKQRLRRLLLRRVHGQLRCALCKKPLAASRATLDHIIPRSRGGTDDLENLQLVHRRCNLRKGNTMPGKESCE